MTIEEAVRAKLLTMSAVTAITTIVRVEQAEQRDDILGAAAVLILLDAEVFEEGQTIDGRCELVIATMTISAISGKSTRARALAEAIRTNGTVPGTGLQGCNVTGLGLDFEAMLERRTYGTVPNEDGSDSGLFSVDSIFTVLYRETT